MSRWGVRKCGDRWAISHPRWGLIDSFPDLREAHTEATKQAIMDALHAPGGLEEFHRLKEDAAWWRAYLEACEVVSR